METYITPREQKIAEAQKRVKRMKGFYIHASVYILVNLFIIFCNAVLEGNGFNDIENYLTAIFWGFGLAMHAFSVVGRNLIFGKNWEERKIQQMLNK